MHTSFTVCSVRACMWLCKMTEIKTSFQCSGCRSNPFEVNCLLFRAPFAFICVMFHLMIYRCWLSVNAIAAATVAVCCFSCMCYQKRWNARVYLHNIPMNGNLYIYPYKEQDKNISYCIWNVNRWLILKPKFHLSFRICFDRRTKKNVAHSFGLAVVVFC